MSQFSNKIKQSPLPFEEHLSKFENNLDWVCEQLVTTCHTDSSDRILLVWFSPLPPREMSELHSQQFRQIVNACHSVSHNHDFHHFSTLRPWPRIVKKLFAKNKCNLSAQGKITCVRLSVSHAKNCFSVFRA
jgi:hypothetical protein